MEINMKKTILGVAVALAVTACSNSRGVEEPLEHWTNFKQDQMHSPQLADNQSLVVFYRQSDIQGPAVNVYINGNYQASLLPNAYTPVAVCSARNLFSSSFSTNVVFGNRTQGVNYTLPVNETTYVKMMQEANGNLNFIRVEPEIAMQEIAQLPKENQTLSRVPAPQNCDIPVLANSELDASALFAFNKSRYQDILPEGKKEIAEFAQHIFSLGNITKIVVSGHTDPSGSAIYNQKLSQERAETVKQALRKLGVTSLIEAVGYGKSQPVVSHCSSLKGKAKHECNQPNRRVEITVYGNK